MNFPHLVFYEVQTMMRIDPFHSRDCMRNVAKIKFPLTKNYPLIKL